MLRNPRVPFGIITLRYRGYEKYRSRYKRKIVLQKV